MIGDPAVIEITRWRNETVVDVLFDANAVVLFKGKLYCTFDGNIRGTLDKLEFGRKKTLNFRKKYAGQHLKWTQKILFLSFQ